MKTPATSIVLQLAGKMRTTRFPTESAGKRKICSLYSPLTISALFLVLIAAAFFTTSSASSLNHLLADTLLPSETTAKQDDRIGSSNTGATRMKFLNSTRLVPMLMPQAAPPDEPRKYHRCPRQRVDQIGLTTCATPLAVRAFRVLNESKPAPGHGVTDLSSPKGLD